MIAATPPAANRSSKFTRAGVPDPSSLSIRPEMLDRNRRFLSVRRPMVSVSSAMAAVSCGSAFSGGIGRTSLELDGVEVIRDVHGVGAIVLGTRPGAVGKVRTQGALIVEKTADAVLQSGD